jgi:cell division protein FtsI (penicillin-binding protein 3)
MRGAFASANWFGDADRSLRYLPNAHADAMPSSAALIFGKWFTFVAMSLCAMLGYVLTLIWMSLKNPSKKMFVLFWGGTMVGGTLYTFCQCIGIVPAIGFSPVLIGYGGTIAAIFWCGLGILLSLLSDEEEYKKRSRKKTVVVGSVFCSLIVIILLGMEVQRGLGCKFYQVSVNTSRLGEFGSNAKRGEIYASDGTVLARSVKRYDVRIDPEIAREHKIAVNEDSLTNICLRLGLMPAELLDFCHIDKSRYVLVKSNVDESVAKWFRSDEGRRLSKGFIVETIQEREYPLGSNAVHVTGCVYRWPGKTSEGATGIEYTCNEVLAGRDGKKVRDAGRSEQLALATPIHGGRVTTTIVPSIQNLLADALMKAVATNNAESAWGIVMNATNGEIAAIASLPTYHPAKSRDIKSGPCYFSNNAAGMIFEPGALMKPLTYAMALDKELITLDTEIDHGNGVWEYSGKHFRDIHAITGVMSVAKAFIKRTNIAPCKIGLMMWKDRDLENISHWGFGQKVGDGTV